MKERYVMIMNEEDREFLIFCRNCKIRAFDKHFQQCWNCGNMFKGVKLEGGWNLCKHCINAEQPHPTCSNANCECPCSGFK